MQAIETLREEHEAVVAVLDQLDRAVRLALDGTPVPPSVFADIAEFFGTFVDRCHHAKEESAVFPRLGAAGAVAVAQFEADHAKGRSLAAEFAEAAAGWVPGDTAAAGRLLTATLAYAPFLRGHIARETEELLPLMERSFDHAADAAIAEAFERIETEQLGAGTHERLHAMIHTLEPRITAGTG